MIDIDWELLINTIAVLLFIIIRLIANVSYKVAERRFKSAFIDKLAQER